MFTYEDYLKIFNYLKDGTVSDLDPNTLTLALSEQVKSDVFFQNTIDQNAYNSLDFQKLRDFLVDWYASHRTIVSTQKNVSDIYSIPESHLNELFYSFGFDVGESIQSLPYENKIAFFYDLVNLYKIKGTPYSVFKVLSYFGVPSLEIFEYWLKIDSSGDLYFDGERIFKTPDITVLTPSQLNYSVTLNDPHWFYTESQIKNLFATNKIRFPSKSPYYGIRPSYSISYIQTTIAWISRKVQDDYSTWDSGGTLTKDIRSLGFDISFLENYLGFIYAYRRQSDPTGKYSGNFICYDGTSLPDFDTVYTEFNTLSSRSLTRAEIVPRYEAFLDEFSRAVTTNFLRLYSDPGEVLALINSSFKDEIDYYFYAAKEDEVVRTLLSDMCSWLRTNVSVYASSLASYCLDFDAYSLGYLGKAVNFFKPYHARLIATEKIIQVGSPVEDSVVPEDSLALDTTSIDYFYDYDTADSHPSFLDGTSLVYYTREHFDSGSYFDIGAGWDRDVLDMIMNEDIIDKYNVHPGDSTGVVDYSYTLDSTGVLSTAYQTGGFVGFDEGWSFDSPFANDICNITVISLAPEYEDIEFWWRADTFTLMTGSGDRPYFYSYPFTYLSTTTPPVEVVSSTAAKVGDKGLLVDSTGLFHLSFGAIPSSPQTPWYDANIIDTGRIGFWLNPHVVPDPRQDIFYWRMNNNSSQVIISSDATEDYNPYGFSITSQASRHMDTTHQSVGNGGVGNLLSSYGTQLGLVTNNPLKDISDFATGGQIGFWLNFISGVGGAEVSISDYNISGSVPSNAFRLYFNATSIIDVILRCNGVNVFNLTSSSSISGIHHIAVRWSYDVGRAYLYVDGVLASSTLISNPVTFSGNDTLYWGNISGNPAQICLDNIYITEGTNKILYNYSSYDYYDESWDIPESSEVIRLPYMSRSTAGVNGLAYYRRHIRVNISQEDNWNTSNFIDTGYVLEEDTWTFIEYAYDLPNRELILYADGVEVWTYTLPSPMSLIDEEASYYLYLSYFEDWS